MKKWIFWVVMGVLAVLAGVFYLAAVRPKAARHTDQRTELESRKSDLRRLRVRGRQAGGIPGPRWIANTQQYVDKVDEEIARCEKLFVPQRRDTHRRRFWDNPDAPFRQPIRKPVLWLKRYTKRCAELTEQIVGIGGSQGRTFNFRSWGADIPDDELIQIAQTEFWFQKDIADILTNQAEKGIERFLTLCGEELVPGLLELVQNLHIEKTEQFRARQKEEILRRILEALVMNPDGLDLPQIFGPHKLWQDLRKIASTKAQQNIIKAMRSPKQDKGQLADYVQDLRTVRYLTDIRDLCSLHGENDLYKLLKEHKEKHTLHTEKAVLDFLREWQKPRVAHAIAFLISIGDEKDLGIVQANHRVDIGALDEFSMVGAASAGPAPAGPAPETDQGRGGDEPRVDSGRERFRMGQRYIGAGVPDMYDVIPFRLRVRLEFQKLPVLLRRKCARAHHH